MNKIICLIGVLVFMGCESDSSLFFTSDHSEGLSVDDLVELNGIEIGKVTDVQISKKGEILFKVWFNPYYDLPIDSKFQIVSRDILGTKGIDVTPGKSDSMIAYLDTLILLQTPPIQLDSLFNETLTDLLRNVTDVDQLVSLQKTLDELSKTLDSISEK